MLPPVVLAWRALVICIAYATLTLALALAVIGLIQAARFDLPAAARMMLWGYAAVLVAELSIREIEGWDWPGLD